jgi:hypothetical protein
VVVKAYAYRTPDDPRPGIGHSSLTIPGATPYTRGSELENAETSAWGRALAALGFEVKKAIASADEVRSKRIDEKVAAANVAHPSEPPADLPPPLDFDYPEVLTSTGEHGSEAVCPAHHKPYVEGTYGPYCQAKSDDPAWSNPKGYCNIKPKSAAMWLRAHA